jgi:murein DD-endopeptidase MepM/ murein hydrolase activator NlpD
VVIPRRSNSGPVEVRGEGGIARTEPIRITATAAGAGAGEPASAGERVFPIVGRHDYGTEINRFGGGRGHQGQDVFAACGAKLVAAESGRVLMSTFQARAGNYLVLQHADGRATAYMHMRSAPLVAKGDRVQAGDPIGEVGDTGRASGCHLHFELWTAPGWYRGGQAIDPLPFLRELDDQLR